MVLIVRVKGSGGYILADLNDDEVGRARLAGELFIGALGRIDESRILSYHCTSCSRELEGSPIIRSSDAMEEVGVGHILVEQGEYICRECKGVIARYKVFGRTGRANRGHATPDTSAVYRGVKAQGRAEEARRVTMEGREGISLRRVIEEGAGVFYKGDRVGVIRDVIVRDGRVLLLVGRDDGSHGDDGDELVLPWEAVESIGYDGIRLRGRVCSRCRYENSILDAYCAECGNRL